MNFSTASPEVNILCPEDNHSPKTQLNSQSNRPPAFVIPVAFASVPLSELAATPSRVYVHACRRTARSGECYESLLGMADYLECSKDTVRLSLQELCKKGMLSCQRRSGKTSIYTLTDPSSWEVKRKEPHLAGSLAYTIPVAFDSIPFSELWAIRGRIYIHVCRRTATSGECYESLPEIADYLECSEDTIRRSLNELCKKGMLSCQRRSGKTSIYTLTDPLSWKVKRKEPHLASPRLATTPPPAGLLPYPSQNYYPTPSSRTTQRNKSKKQLKERTNNNIVVVSFEKKDPEPELTGKQINTSVEQHESDMNETDSSLDAERKHLFRRAKNLIDGNLTPALEQELRKYSIARVEAALAALQEASDRQKVQRPAGFLMKALQGGWNPSARVREAMASQEFNEWFNLAKAADIVAGSQRQGDEIVCHTCDGKCVPLRELMAKHSVEVLRQVAADKQRAEAALSLTLNEPALREPAFA